MGENGNLKDHLDRRKRVNRIKNGLIMAFFAWMIITVAALLFLLYRVNELQKEVNLLAEQKVYTGQVSIDENAASNSVMVPDTEIPEAGAPVAELVNDEDNLAEEGDIPEVYLTFDDGPSSNTEEILDILDQYGVKATFFVIGKEDEESQEIYKRIVEEGHTLGMHSYSNKYSEIYSSVENFETDFVKIKNYLTEVTGQTPEFYRFPGGSSNQVSNTDMGEFIQYLNEQGITYFDWNVSSGDATSQAYTSEEIVDNVVSDVVKYKTSVVLLHDSDNKDVTVEALAPLITALQEINAEILPIDEDTRPVQYAVVHDTGDGE